jgi:hypothetical protein
MKAFIGSIGIGIGAVMVIGIVLAAQRGMASEARRVSLSQHESPFACSPSALDERARKQHFEEYGPKLRAQLRGARELPDGYEFTFASSDATYRILSDWMYQERQCCPFFDLALDIDREGGPLRLRLAGRAGVKEFIRAEFEPWFLALRGRG